jgi:hypothetical protein
MPELPRNPPFRAEHLGSLLRPHNLLKIRADLDKGKSTKKEVESVEREAIKEIVDTQLRLGFHAITDGEYGRHSQLHLISQDEVFSFGPMLFLEMISHSPISSVLGRILAWAGRD